MTYRLFDAARRSRDNATFEVPSEADRKSIQVGDFVKLLFGNTECSPYTERPHDERMWVNVTEVDGHNYTGTLANHPSCFTSIQFGSIIKFKPDHICDIE